MSIIEKSSWITSFDRSLDLSIELWAGRTEKKFPLYVSLIKNRSRGGANDLRSFHVP